VAGLTVTIVVAGIVLSIVVGIGRGLDVTAIVMLIPIVAVGALAIGVARRSRSGAVAPGRCERCGGLISASAPYCKHCGAPSPGA
jgi:hypothetical protein